MRYTYNFLILLSLCILCTTGCSKFVKSGKNLEKIKILRVTGATQLDIMRNGAYEVVSLAGVYIPSDEEINKMYLESGEIDKKYRDQITDAAAKARMFLYDSLSSGDLVFAETMQTDSQNIKVREFIIYTPDMVSVNEKLVTAGYAFPHENIADKMFADRLHKNLKDAVTDHRGLWLIGENILNKNNSTQKQKPVETPSTPTDKIP